MQTQLAEIGVLEISKFHQMHVMIPVRWTEEQCRHASFESCIWSPTNHDTISSANCIQENTTWFLHQ